MKVPMIMTHEPNMMHHRRPNVSLTSGIRGNPMTEPSGRAEARIPLYDPVGWPKTGVKSQDTASSGDKLGDAHILSRQEEAVQN
jgi:hypothetical protein